jgi:hypothetical protein
LKKWNAIFDDNDLRAERRKRSYSSQEASFSIERRHFFYDDYRYAILILFKLYL